MKGELTALYPFSPLGKQRVRCIEAAIHAGSDGRFTSDHDRNNGLPDRAPRTFPPAAIVTR